MNFLFSYVFFNMIKTLTLESSHFWLNFYDCRVLVHHLSRLFVQFFLFYFQFFIVAQSKNTICFIKNIDFNFCLNKKLMVLKVLFLLLRWCPHSFCFELKEEQDDCKNFKHLIPCIWRVQTWWLKKEKKSFVRGYVQSFPARPRTPNKIYMLFSSTRVH